MNSNEGGHVALEAGGDAMASIAAWMRFTSGEPKLVDLLRRHRRRRVCISSEASYQAAPLGSVIAPTLPDFAFAISASSQAARRS
jgi:hypothetical protein